MEILKVKFRNIPIFHAFKRSTGYENPNKEKNMSEAINFAIVNMIQGDLKQINVASHVQISKSNIPMVVNKFICEMSYVIKKRGRKFKLKSAAIRILQPIIVQTI